MFCPNCGQQQMSPSVRYCSRCRSSLRGVLSVRRKDLVHGGLLIFIGLMIIFGFNDFIRGFLRFWTNLTEVPLVWSPDYVLPFFSAVFVIWGLARIVLALFMEFVIERPAHVKQQRQDHSFNHTIQSQVGGASPSALTQSQATPVVEPEQRFDTGQLVGLPSATEETTRPLKNKR